VARGPSLKRLRAGVDAQFASVAVAEPVVLESPIENLALSSRARNALRSLGCNSVQDILRLDLSGPVRGIGRKTRGEVLTALRSSGLPHPGLDELLDSDIRSLDRSLERMHGRISVALGAVTKEIAMVQKKLRKRMEARNGARGGGVTTA
jgi:Bacterial RNA polymerase, alpha chain C terminal domain